MFFTLYRANYIIPSIKAKHQAADALKQKTARVLGIKELSSAMIKRQSSPIHSTLRIASSFLYLYLHYINYKNHQQIL